MSKLEDQLEHALAKVEKAPKKKSLVTIIFEKMDEIERLKKAGATYKEIAEAAGVEYKFFLSSLNRARKRHQKSKKHDLQESETKNSNYKKNETDTNKEEIDTAENNKIETNQSISSSKKGAKIIRSKTESLFSDNLNLNHTEE